MRFVALTALALALASCSSNGRGAKPEAVWNGPLIAASHTGYGQNNAEPGQLIISLSTVTLINRSLNPVTITGLSEWQPIGLHLAEAELTYGRKFGNGGGAPGGSAYDAAMNAADPRWEWVRPLLGATIGPHRDDHYTLALGFRVADGHRAGTIRGIVLTYRTSAGDTYRVRVPVLISYCTADFDEVPECKAVDDRATELFTEDKPLRTPTDRERNSMGTWPDDD